jgi:hypothetical protein
MIMKRFLSLFLIMSIVIFGFAQKGTTIPKNLRDVSIQVSKKTVIDDNSMFENTFNPTVNNKPAAKSQEQIGTTYYDLQSNQALGNRLYLWPDDGTISAVWTMGLESDVFPDRGTGYNYFDGNSWGDDPTVRIESDRTGWPNIAAWGENGEIVVSHTGVAAGLHFLTRDTKGTGAWNSFYLAGPDATNVLVWPRMVTSGVNHDVIQLICPGGNAVAYNGQTPALLYSRSTDGGASWDPIHEVLPGTGADFYTGLNADEYTWAEPKGDVIAFQVCDAFHDWFIMKSLDGGTTWNKIMVWECPYPFFDFNVTLTTDTLWAPDGAADIAIDNYGKVHVVSGLTRVARFSDTPAGQYTYWPYSDGVAYWNEDMPPFTNAEPHDALDAWDVLVPDYNLIGWEQDVNNNGVIDLVATIMSYRSISLTTMTNLAIGPDNGIYVVFAATTEGYVYGNDEYNYKHIWTRRSPDGGINWSPFVDLNTDLIQSFDECIYPVLAKNVDDNIHMFYNVDATPGLALDSDHPYQENRWLYFTENINTLYTGIKNNESNPSVVEVKQNFPNPANSTTFFEVKLIENADLSLEVTNMLGQVVYQINKGIVNAGTQILKLDVSGFNAGIYFYTVKAGDSSVTRKMMVE